MERKGWSDVCRKRIMVPIIKKGKGEVIEKYRRVTLIPTLYKIYTVVLAERIKKEVEGKRMILHNQAGFRRGMGTTYIFPI